MHSQPKGVKYGYDIGIAEIVSPKAIPAFKFDPHDDCWRSPRCRHVHYCRFGSSSERPTNKLCKLPLGGEFSRHRQLGNRLGRFRDGKRPNKPSSRARLHKRLGQRVESAGGPTSKDKKKRTIDWISCDCNTDRGHRRGGPEEPGPR